MSSKVIKCVFWICFVEILPFYVKARPCRGCDVSLHPAVLLSRSQWGAATLQGHLLRWMLEGRGLQQTEYSSKNISDIDKTLMFLSDFDTQRLQMFCTFQFSVDNNQNSLSSVTHTQLLSICNYAVTLTLCVQTHSACMADLSECDLVAYVHEWVFCSVACRSTESWFHLPSGSNESNPSDSWPCRCSLDNLPNALNLLGI